MADHGWRLAIALAGNSACALLGSLLLLRRQSMLGDAISHAVLPSVVLAYLLMGRISLPATLALAVGFGILTAWLSEALRSLGGVAEDSALGIVFTALFALGVLLIHRHAEGVDLDVGCVLQGNLELSLWHELEFDFLGFRGRLPRALPGLVATLAVSVAALALLWKEWRLLAFDPAFLAASGFRAGPLAYAQSALVAATVVVALESVGSILVVAMLVAPAAAARLLTDRYGAMFAAALGVSAVATGLGYAAAQRFDVATSGAMAVAGGGLFLLAALFGPERVLIPRLLRRRRFARRIAADDLLAKLFRAEDAGAPLQSLAGPERRTGRRLVRKGQLERLDAAWRLTDAGRRAGRDLVRTHRVWERYLHENFNLPPDHLHGPADRIEHFLDAETRRKIAAELRDAETDPHGRPIPGER